MQLGILQNKEKKGVFLSQDGLGACMPRASASGPRYMSIQLQGRMEEVQLGILQNKENQGGRLYKVAFPSQDGLGACMPRASASGPRYVMVQLQASMERFALPKRSMLLSSAHACQGRLRAAPGTGTDGFMMVLLDSGASPACSMHAEAAGIYGLILISPPGVDAL